MDLYGLIHARFILSPRGLAMMKEKYMLGSFGYCPRVLCERQNILPIGVSEELSTSRVKVYCPRCQDVYIPRQKQLDIDGAYFGTSFPHVLLKVNLNAPRKFEATKRRVFFIVCLPRKLSSLTFFSLIEFIILTLMIVYRATLN